MKNKTLLNLFLTAVLFSFLSSCDSGPDVVNFTINGIDIAGSEEEPTDTLLFYKIFRGDEIAFADASDPITDVSSRVWDLDGDGQWDEALNDQDLVKYHYEEEGNFKIIFCANGEKKCMTKWVKVLPIIDRGIFLEPSVSFTSPSQMYSSTPKKSIEITVETENVFTNNELSLLLNGEEADFTFDIDKALLKAKVRLKKGENKIEVKANTEDGDVSEFVFVEYGSGGGSGGSGEEERVIPKVRISSSATTFAQADCEVKVRTKHFDGDQLAVTLNNQPITDYSKVSNGNWVVRLNLKEGRNKLTVSASDENGVGRAKKTITFKPPAAPPIKPIETPVTNTTAPSVRITSPANNYKTKKARQEVLIKSENLINPKGLSILHNGKKVSDYSFDPTRKLWVAYVNFSELKNEIEAIVKNNNGASSDKIVIDYDVPDEQPEELGTAGLDIGKRGGACASADTEEYSFTIAPSETIELLAFTVFSTICGGMELTLTSDRGGRPSSATVPLIKGKNQISLDDLRARMKAGRTYTIRCKTISGYGNCKSNTTPKLENAANCKLQPISSSSFKVDYQGKSIIYDLKFLF